MWWERSLFHVWVANLTSMPVADLHTTDSLDSDITEHVSSQELHLGVQESEPLTHLDLSAKLQNFQGTAEKMQQLLDLLTSYSSAISHDNLGYTDQEFHSLWTINENPSVQRYCFILPRDFH